MMGGPPTHLMWSNMFSPDKPAVTKKVAWRRLAVIFVPYRRQIALIIVCVTLGALLGLLPPLFTKWLVDGLLHAHDMTVVYQNVGGMIVSALAGGLVMVYQGYLNAQMGEGILRDLRVSLIGHLQRMSLTFFTNTRSGEIINRISSDVDNIDNVLTGTLVTIVSNIIVMLTTLVTIFWLDWRLSLISLAIIPLMIIPLSPVGRRMYDIRKRTREQRDELEALTLATLSLSGVTLIKSFVREHFEEERYRVVADRLAALEIRLAMVGRWFIASMNGMVVIGPALVWMAGAYFVLQGTATIGTVVAFVAFLARIYSPASALAGVQVQIVSALAVFERILEYLDMQPEHDRPAAIEPTEVHGEIHFDHVHFTYSDDREVLNDIDLRVAAGSMAAFVGVSGAGKSTLMSLVTRFYDVSAGRIMIDDLDVRDWTLHALRSHIGVVTQETYLFHDTVARNLRYAKEDATQAELEAAARAANIHDVIERLPNKYETTVGERGHKLSGGERQRLAIARALLKDPKILILDEATSALDSHNETLIQQALQRLMQGRTSLVIAHRLSTIVEADVIFVMDGGRLVESGTHTALLAAGGAYAALYRDRDRLLLEIDNS